ncbi:MAG: AIPR family protein [Desulfobacteria bacterium]
MTNLVTFSTINEKVKKYLEDYSLDDMSTAFEWLALETILNLNEDEIEDAITDGAMDGGIDAIHIAGRDVHIFNFKYTEIFENTKNNFPETETDKILVTMAGIYGKSLKKDDVNELLWEKVNEIWDLFDKGTPNFKYYLCSNKEKPIEHAKRKFEQNLDKYKYVEYHYYDQEDIVSRILEKKYRKINGEINFVDLQYFDRSDGPLKGIVATVAATDLIKLVQDPNEPTKIIEDVFNENVRVYMKLKNRINRGIYDTALSDENYEFWYLNNGITIVCDECIYAPNTRSPRVKLTNLQIVNGGQTTHALFEAYLKDSSKLNNVLIIVRICETKNYRISERISETTNSQTPVRTRDLHASDRMQKVIEEQFKVLGYFYERKKNQHEQMPKSERLDNELLGQIYLAFYLDMPSEAKNQKVIVFSDKYEEIFDEASINAKKMLIPYRVFLPIEVMKKEIQRKKRKREAINEKDAFISRATFHILNSVKLISEKENLNLENQDDINQAIKKAISYIAEVVELESQNRGELYTHDKFFKEIPTNKIIREHISSKYPKNGG